VNKLLRFEVEFGSGLGAFYAVYFVPNNKRFGSVYCDTWDWIFEDDLRSGSTYSFDILSELTEFMRPLQEEAVKQLSKHLDETIP
jgi:hypothetical protein